MTASAAHEILDHARDVLVGKHRFPARNAPRAAALLARQALEQAVLDLCSERGAELACATMRSRLIALRGLAGDTIADLANIAWSGLSGCCHHHAYELGPTVGEVSHLIDRVAQLMPTTAPD